MTTDLSQLERLRLIVKACRDCGQEPDHDIVAGQYQYETGEYMDEALYEKVVK
jgi:hypothetical protein